MAIVLNFNTYSWDKERLALVCSTDEVEQIVDASPPVKGVDDILQWTKIASGSYTIASNYSLLLKSYHP